MMIGRAGSCQSAAGVSGTTPRKPLGPGVSPGLPGGLRPSRRSAPAFSPLPGWDELCRGRRGGWGSPHRGRFNMTWDFSPSLAEINPVAFNYYYQNASAGEYRDFFITASGPGIMFPSRYGDLDGFIEANAEALRKVDQNIVSIIDPDWDVADLNLILETPEVMGIMFKTYEDAYRGLHGYIHWHRGKPVIAVKYSLWDGVDSPDDIVSALNSAPTNAAADQQSYSVVNVHPWSTSGQGDPMSNVAYIVERLDSNVEVVPLDELIIHLRRNFGTPVEPPP